MVKMMKTGLKFFVYTILLLIAVIALWLAFNWRIDKTVDDLRPRWAPAPSQFINMQGLQVHLRDEGPRTDPTPIVLIHGTSASLHTWEAWVSALKEQHRVITMDLPGFGMTGPDKENDYSDAYFTQFILHLMDQLGVQNFIVGGNSLGGEIAWQVAAVAPQRVQKLILVDAGGYAFTPESMPIGFRIARTPGLNMFMEVTLPRKVMEDSVKNVYGNPNLVTPALIDRYEDMTLRAGNRHALIQRFKQLDNGANAPLIKTLKLPTLIIWGKHDRLIPPLYAHRFNEDIAGSHLVIFDALGHVPHEEDPAATVTAVKNFLQ